MRQMLHATLKSVFPDQCVLCGEITEGDGGLCASCWRETPFLLSRGCLQCGAPILGEDGGDVDHCEECHSQDRPWDRGTALMRYEGAARRIVMSVKHGDRLDLLPKLAAWLAPKVRPLVGPDTLIIPVPLHWRRLFVRRHNQAAGLARALAAELDLPCLPDALVRTRATAPQKGISRAERFDRQAGSVRAAPLWRDHLRDRPVLIIDDVMTTGATISACASACKEAGASDIRVATLARAVRNT